MPKATAAQRLTQAIARTKTRVEEHIKKIASSQIRNGLCIIMPTHTSVLPPTYEQMEALKATLLEKFKHENLFGLAIQYFIPPLGVLPSYKKEGESDYKITAEIVEFDEKWQIDQFVKELLYCPSDKEIGAWHPRYDKQSDALSLTPLLDMAFKDLHGREIVREFLNQSAKDFFMPFAKDYAKKDLNFPESDRKKDIRILYPEIQQFPEEGSPIFHAYVQARKIKRKTKNQKIKDLMHAFMDCIEKHCMGFASEVGAPVTTKEEILNSLQEAFPKSKKRYEAERPAQGLSYFRIAQILIIFILEFLEQPKKYLSSGEISMFIWLCQHIAFDYSQFGIKIIDLLNLKTTDVNISKKCLRIKGFEIRLTLGLLEIFVAWIGEEKRINARKFFSTLSFDLLADNFKRVSKTLPSFDRDLLPKDLLITPHTMNYDAEVDKNIREKLDQQSKFVSKSSYANTAALTKQIREEISSTITKSMS